MSQCLCVFQDLLLGLIFSNTENLLGDAFLIHYPGTRGHYMDTLAEGPYYP